MFSLALLLVTVRALAATSTKLRADNLLNLRDVAMAVTRDDQGMVVRVLIVDDHALFAEALAARLSFEPDFEVLPVAQDAVQAQARLATEEPDVVVLDLILGNASGLDVLDYIGLRHPQTRALILSAVSGVGPIVEAIRHGAAAWVPKTAGGDVVVSVISGVARGDAWIPPDLLAEVLRQLIEAEVPSTSPEALAGLTAREFDVLQCMVDGLGRADTAARLGVSINTVRTHVRSLLAKLDLHSGLEATGVALRAGMRPTHHRPPSF
jgi:DNA-binding NarL/FixJ family response regulator